MTVPVPETQPSEFLTERDCQDAIRLGKQLFIIVAPAVIFAHALLHLPDGVVSACLTPVCVLIAFGWSNRQKIQRGEKIPRIQREIISPRARTIRVSLVTTLFALLGLWCSVRLFPFLVHPFTHLRYIFSFIGAVYLEILIVSVAAALIRLMRQTIRQERTRLRATTALTAPMAAMSQSPLETPMTPQTVATPITRHWWTESQLRQEILTQGHNER